MLELAVYTCSLFFYICLTNMQILTKLNKSVMGFSKHLRIKAPTPINVYADVAQG